MAEEEIYDMVIVGGGAAGYFGAISSVEAAPWSKVLILEKTGEVLTKVKISGGGRCNVTHDCLDPRELTKFYPRGEKALIGPFHRWGPSDTIDWFASKGVELKVESDGRMFPVTDNSKTIMDCLTKAAEEGGVELRLRAEVESLESDGREWVIRLSEGEKVRCRAVLLATGGTRNNAGVKLAGELGHELVPAAPSLFTFKIDDPRLDGFSGISVPQAEASVPVLKLKTEGPCLITHWGLSGPAILKLSARGARELADQKYRFDVVINWCGLKEPELLEIFSRAREKSPRKRVRSGLGEVAIPTRLWTRLAEHAGVGEETIWANLSKTDRHSLILAIIASRFNVNGKSMNKDEFVTAGGVNLMEVNFKTMESRLHSGLFFAGEVLDIDGVTGGFNFQLAWTTGRIAGEAAVAGA